LGALASLLFIALNPTADFLTHAKGPQMGRQIAAVVTTLAVSIVSGFVTGKVMALLEQDDIQDGTNLFVDKSYWETAYFDPSVRPNNAAAANSGSSNRMISPNSKHSVKAICSQHSHKYDLAASNRAEAAVAPAPEQQQQHAVPRVDLDEDVSENV
jgi:predicted PurR-regulated permease PerM